MYPKSLEIELTSEDLAIERKFDAEHGATDAVWAFAKAVLHGSEEHQNWLLNAAARYLRGLDLPPPRG